MKLKCLILSSCRKSLWLLILICTDLTSVFGQSPNPSSDIRKLVSALSLRQETDAKEAIYIQLDKGTYASSDTLWYKAYVFDANQLSSTKKSGILHVDLLSSENEVIKRFLVPLTAGLGGGHFPLVQAELSDGEYILKAYTNWMLNFDNKDFFSKKIRIISEKTPAELSLPQTAVKSISKVTKVGMPSPNRQDYDVQFLPEGGHLVAGIETNVGCKVLSVEGKGVGVSGNILNGKDEVVAAFTTSPKGIGSFKFLPLNGEKYTAIITSSGDVKRNYVLPDLKSSGTVLNVDNHPDSSLLTITVSRSELPNVGPYYLIMSCRAGAYAVEIDLKELTTQRIQIQKKKFPTGILRVTLLNEAHQSLNDRIVFINHWDFLNMEVQTDKDVYERRDSVGISFAVNEMQDKAIVGSFSVAVTDDSQVNPYSVVNGNLLTETLLKSGVKGDIESPADYFENHKDAAKALDLLLMTQGWTAFDWQGLFIDPELKYEAETDFEIKGRVVGAFNGSKVGRKVALLSTKPLFLKDTLTDDKGDFIFKDLPTFELPVFQIRTSNKNDKSFNLNIEIEERKFPEYARIKKQQKEWTDLTISTNEELSRLKEVRRKLEGFELKEVNISAKKIVNRSDNLNGPGEADQVLNEEDLKKEAGSTLLEVLEKRIKGFMLTPAGATVNTQPVKFIFDAMDLEFGEAFSPIDLRNTLNSYSMENITGLEVSFNMKYTSRYNFRHIENSNLISYVEGGPAYIEITTRSKNGPFSRKSKGMYLYRSLPFSLPLQEFYGPKYSRPKVQTDLPDLRPTVYWNPNILTAEDGKASFSFYTTDIPGTYTIIVEGSDMAGNLGFLTRKIIVK